MFFLARAPFFNPDRCIKFTKSRFFIPLREVGNSDRYLSIEMRARKFMIFVFFCLRRDIFFQKKVVFWPALRFFMPDRLFFRPFLGINFH